MPNIYEKLPTETDAQYYARLPGSAPGSLTTGVPRPGIDTPANTGGPVGEVPEKDLDGNYYYRSSGQGNFGGETIGNIYGSTGNSELDKANKTQLDNARSAYQQPDPNDPAVQAKIRADALAAFQAEIDATNAIYADKLETAAREGRGRLGTTTAMSARAGLLGSDFGQAQYSTVEQGNRDIANEIQNEKALKISNIMSKAREQATKDIADKVTARKAGLDDYIKYLGEAQTRKATNAKTAAKVLLSQGKTSSELDANTLKSVLDGYGITKDELDKAYNEEKPLYETAQTAKKTADAELKYKEAQIAELQGKTLTPEQLKAKMEGDLRMQEADIAYKKSQSAVNWANANKINAGDDTVPTVKNIGGVDMQWDPKTKAWITIGNGISATPDKTISQLDFLEGARARAMGLSDAAGRSGLRKTVEGVLVGATDYSQLENLTNTLKVNVLSLMTDPNIKKFFGPQMSNADVTLMTSAGTTLDPERNRPEQLRAELVRLEDLFKRMKTAVGEGQSSKIGGSSSVGGVVNNAAGLPDGTTVVGDDGKNYIVRGGQFVAQ